ncbi:hypothetical protein AXX12_08240 [Anaerosporomusa subterranea]|uniref:Polysaccharide chain length determinant N-terminal domain-containing protein n=1 Tax=Anaerosporomusa subterranea TaxID=1794912 RepID=A0A154BQX3_ANASB|nr:Wzz/FepE/Etk N-terminal domain-containing protein [Anaerosporomusa subterranea]KYZ76413.1 hypothetical protein AXX12_08240 [Anaerosporomusa subterranea]
MNNDSQEIGLGELFSIIKQYKKFIFSFMLLSLLAAGTYSYLNPRYDSSAIVAIGHIDLSPTVYLEDPNEVMRRLNNGAVQAATDTKVPNYITVKAQAKTAAAAKEAVSQATDELLQRHDSLFEESVRKRNLEREEIINQIKSNDSIIATIDKLSYDKQNIPAVALMIYEKGQLSQIQMQLRRQIIEVEKRNSPPYVKKTSLISSPSLQSKPAVSPIVIYSTASFAGLACSIIMVFLYRAFQSMRKVGSA